MRLRTAIYEGSDTVEAAARRLRRTLHGPLHRPGEAAYDVLRRPHAPALDPRPALGVEAYGAADVRAAVVAACDYGLPFAVHGDRPRHARPVRRRRARAHGRDGDRPRRP